MLPVRSKIFVDSAFFLFSKLLIAGMGVTVAHTTALPSAIRTNAAIATNESSAHGGSFRHNLRSFRIMFEANCIFNRLVMLTTDASEMRYRYGDGIIFVVIFDFFFNLHERMKHLYDCALVGAPRACRCALYFTGRVLEDRYTDARGRADECAAHFRDPHRSFLILGDVKLFERKRIGFVYPKKSRALFGDSSEPLWKFIRRRRFDTCRIKDLLFLIFFFDYRNAAAPIPRIDCKDFHMRIVSSLTYEH